MQQFIDKFIVSRSSWGDIAHLVLNGAMPIVAFALIYFELSWLAVVLVLVAKWRALAVRPRFWFSNLRANSVDIVVGVSTVLLMAQAASLWVRLFWLAWYLLWLWIIKPRSDTVSIGMQALASHFLGFMALFSYADSTKEYIIVFVAWLIAITGSRHFINAYEEEFTRVMSFAWALFIAQLVWLSHRWLVVFTVGSDISVPQVSIVSGLLAYGLGTLYHLHKTDKLKPNTLIQYASFIGVILLIVAIFSDWSGDID